jgi:hypothetical protein
MRTREDYYCSDGMCGAEDCRRCYPYGTRTAALDRAQEYANILSEFIGQRVKRVDLDEYEGCAGLVFDKQTVWFMVNPPGFPQVEDNQDDKS